MMTGKKSVCQMTEVAQDTSDADNIFQTGTITGLSKIPELQTGGNAVVVDISCTITNVDIAADGF